MYCQQCGIHNTSDAEHCRICDAESAEILSSTPAIIYSDLTQFSFLTLMAHIQKTTNFLLWIVYIPIVGLAYALRKFSKTPFLNPHMNGKSPKRASLKFALSWLLILCLVGGIGWQVSKMMGGWLSPSPLAGNSRKITLEPRWLQDFESEEHPPLTSFINRGAHSIVSTAHSVYAVDMLTGGILWQNSELPGLFLQALSVELERPLLALQFCDDGQKTLVRFDPTNGNILWRQTLEGSDLRLNFDARHIAVLSDSHVSLYNADGEHLWQKSFQDKFAPKSIVFHHGILLTRHRGEKVHLTYLAREHGELLWERKDSTLIPAYAIPDIDQQVFYTGEGESLLFDLNKQEELWDSPRDLEHVIGHTVDPQSGQIYLHSTKGMARLQSGELHFSYPAGFRLVEASDEYLILLQDRSGRQNTCLLLDKSSGETVQQIYERKWFALFYLSEDEKAIYLASNSKAGKSGDNSIHTSLVRLDKKSWDVKETPLGRNIGLIRFKVFPQERLVFIPLFQRIGGYLLPEM